MTAPVPLLRTLRYCLGLSLPVTDWIRCYLVGYGDYPFPRLYCYPLPVARLVAPVGLDLTDYLVLGAPHYYVGLYCPLPLYIGPGLPRLTVTFGRFPVDYPLAVALLCLAQHCLVTLWTTHLPSCPLSPLPWLWLPSWPAQYPSYDVGYSAGVTPLYLGALLNWVELPCPVATL